MECLSGSGSGYLANTRVNTESAVELKREEDWESARQNTERENSTNMSEYISLSRLSIYMT